MVNILDRCGSGCVLTFLALELGSTNAFYLGSDINPYALKSTQKVSSSNGVSMDVLQCSLTNGLRGRLFDLILFNPPYVPTCDEEQPQIPNSWITSAWAGGKDGTVLIHQFLHELPNVLAIPGACYMVLISTNRPFELVTYIEKHYGFICSVSIILNIR
jgi:HemK-related putative methylase